MLVCVCVCCQFFTISAFVFSDLMLLVGYHDGLLAVKKLSAVMSVWSSVWVDVQIFLRAAYANTTHYVLLQ